MTPEERQEMRKCHRSVGNGDEPHCFSCYDAYGEPVPYPCNVITVLNAWEAERAWVAGYTNDAFIYGKMMEPLLNVTPQPLIEPEVIKGSENLKSSDLKTEVECGHMDDERYGEIVFNGIVYKLVPTDQGRGPRSRKNSECSHVLASKQPKLFETGEFMIDIMVANCWCPKCGEKL